MITRLALLAMSATPSPSPSSSTPSGEGAKAGPIGLAVILLLCIACYFLFKSMSKHLRTVREKFPDSDSDPAGPGGPRVTTRPAARPGSSFPSTPGADAPPPAQPPPGEA